jgi:hypothetical protein
MALPVQRARPVREGAIHAHVERDLMALLVQRARPVHEGVAR